MNPRLKDDEIGNICIVQCCLTQSKTEQSYTQLDSRKQAIVFWDRVTTMQKGSSTSTKMSTCCLRNK